MVIRQLAAQGATAAVETARYVKFPVSANFGKKGWVAIVTHTAAPF